MTQPATSATSKVLAKITGAGKRPYTRRTRVPNENRSLTQPMRDFAKYWAQGETISNASTKAGYKDKGGFAYAVLVKDPAILKIYNEEKRLYEAASQMTRKKVMDGLLEGVEMAKTMAEPASVIAGWREIGKMCGYYEPTRKKIDINITGDVTMRKLEQMNDADLLKLIKGEVEDVVFTEVADEDGD